MRFDVAPGRGHHKGGPKRSLDRDALLRERSRIWNEEPRGPERAEALRLVSRRLCCIDKRSPWK